MEFGTASLSTATTSLRDLRPLVLCGLSILEKDALTRKLWDLFPNSFTAAISHTAGGEFRRDIAYDISSDDFLKMVVEGEFAVHYKFGDMLCGISKQAITAATATQRIVILNADMQGVQQLKAIPEFNARYVFITPPSLQLSEARLSPQHSEAGEIQICQPLRRSLAEFGGKTRFPKQDKDELEYARIPGVYDLILPSDNLDNAFQLLVDFIISSDS